MAIVRARKTTAWLNSDLSLFRINSNGEPEYLSGIGVFRVMQGKDGWRVILHGYFPMTLDLFLHGGTMFEVCTKPCGLRDDYEGSTCVMRFSGCEIVRKWIKRPVSFDDMDVVQGYVEMSCDVWFHQGRVNG